MGYLSCRADSSVSVNKPIKIHEYDYSVLEAATHGFSDRHLLGRGSHGHVYKAVLSGRHVAVKRPSKRPESDHNPNNTPEGDNEIQILSRLNSPGLVNLVGVSSDHPSKNRLLVVEFMSKGTLYDVLHGPSSRPPNWPRRIRLALQTARAVETLHSSSPPVIHRDIKSANVLIDRSFNARLGDFGLALQCGDDYRLRSTPPAGTMGYIDPCYVTPDNLSTKTDVFSFGILLLEIISGRKAIDVAHSPPSVVDWAIPLVKKGKVMAIYDPRVAPPGDPVVRKQLAVIAAKCVRSCRERRPAMGDLVKWLNGLCKMLPLHSWSGFNNPCLMADNVGRPVEARVAHFDSRREEGDFGAQAMRNARRVYSDLGMRNNLMDLMAGNDGEGMEGEPRPRSRVLSARFGSGRCVRRGGGGGEGERRSSLGPPANDKVLLPWQRNQSTGNDSSESHSRRFNLVSCQAADDV